jgi:excisionase family DNA binding protein
MQNPALPGIPESQAAQIDELYRVLKLGSATLTSPDGLHQVQLPDPLYRLLLRIIDDLAEGRPVMYASANQDLTTQVAANCLGMSRQFFVGLLEKGEIPFHRVGKHRRITFRDLLAYRQQRDQRRHQAVNDLATKAVESGIYDEF